MIFPFIYDVVALQLESHESLNWALFLRFTFPNSFLPQPYHHPLNMTSPRDPRLGLVFVKPIEVEGLGMTNCPVNGDAQYSPWKVTEKPPYLEESDVNVKACGQLLASFAMKYQFRVNKSSFLNGE